ncbi:hypothetical protein C8R43DRAFT_949074 [Mycena crocata]|nr:hypothetical protein C8R43DRAFT_949074 [Mycena crocata]
MLALLPIILAAQTVFAATTPNNVLFARQTLTPSAGCLNACTSLENAVTSADGTLNSLCTNTIVSAYADCYECMVSTGYVTQALAQQAVDTYVSSCKTAGFPVTGATVSGSGGVVDDSSSSVRGGSATATGAGSTQTTGSSGSSSSGSSGSSSSGSSGSSGDTNGSSSSSSGGDAPSGFKLTGGAGTNAAHLPGAISVLVLSALLLRNI